MKVSLSSMLFVLFLGLQLGGFIAWPWVWVCAPLWIPVVICILVLAITGIFAVVAVNSDSKALKRG